MVIALNAENPRFASVEAKSLVQDGLMEAIPESDLPQTAAELDGNNSTSSTSSTLSHLRQSLKDLRFIQGDWAGNASASEQLRVKIINQISDYLLPRLENLNAPLLAVVGGSTGAGKSTLVNSLLEQNLSSSSAIRPTTRIPVLICHPAEQEWFSNNRVLPGLQRIKTSGSEEKPEASGNNRLWLRSSEAVPQGMALLDAPDIDSISQENRELSGQLLNAADLWIFVTTANRYADALPWDLLVEAGARDITVCVVLNRVPENAVSEIVPDLSRMLDEKNLDSSRLHVIPEVALDDQGRIPTQNLGSLSKWLLSVANDSQERQRIAAQTLDGALKKTAADVNELLAEISGQQVQLHELLQTTEQRFASAFEQCNEALRDGGLLRGEILMRWQDFVGAGELLRGIEGTVGRVRDRIGSFFTGKPPTERRVEQAIEVGLHTILVAEVSQACRDVERTWRNTPLGSALFEQLPSTAPANDLDTEAASVIRAWQQDVLEMIRAEGAGKRKTARLAAFGVNGLAVVLMVLVFASTAGLTGIELGIAGGSAVVGQKLLEAVFGEDAVRRMTARARNMLEDQTETLINKNRDYYLNFISSHLQETSIEELTKFVASTSEKGRHL